MVIQSYQTLSSESRVRDANQPEGTFTVVQPRERDLDYDIALFGDHFYVRSNLVLPNALSRQEWIVRLHDRKSGIPYGITIAIAGLQVYPATAWFQMIGSGF